MANLTLGNAVRVHKLADREWRQKRVDAQHSRMSLRPSAERNQGTLQG
jgi:hypothetical protein